MTALIKILQLDGFSQVSDLRVVKDISCKLSKHSMLIAIDHLCKKDTLQRTEKELMFVTVNYINISENLL